MKHTIVTNTHESSMGINIFIINLNKGASKHNTTRHTNSTINNRKAIASIGNFDGLHRGHQHILQKARQIATEQKLLTLAITFEPSSTEYLAGFRNVEPPHRLSLLRDKAILLKKYALVDQLVIIRFNHALMNLSPLQFIQNILIKLNIVHVVTGEDFRFGHERSGSGVDLLQSNMKHTVVAPCIINNMRISSSLIRQYAINNQLKEAMLYLGHHLQYSARITYGKQLGRQFGVPTINLDVLRYCIPLNGVYVVHVYIDNMRYEGVANIGTNPSTTNTKTHKLEVHLFNVDQNLYGKIATVKILAFLRPEHTFITVKDGTSVPDLDGLFTQINIDIQDAHNYFINHNNPQ